MPTKWSDLIWCGLWFGVGLWLSFGLLMLLWWILQTLMSGVGHAPIHIGN